VDHSSYYWADENKEIMQRIIQHQFPTSCKGKKFIVFRLGKTKSRNIGSISRHALLWLAEALIADRILIWGDEPWKMADCESQSWDCYFKPISNCTLSDLPKNWKKTAVEIHDDLKTFGDPENAHLPVVYAWRLWYRCKLGHVKRLLKIEPLLFQAYAQTYLLRQNEEIKAKVTQNLVQLMEAYPDLDPSKTVSMPMRRGDKCKGHKIKGSSPGEDKCLPLKTWMKAVNRYRCDKFDCDKTKLTHIIVTCGERAVVRNMTELAPKHGWQVIWNKFDVMQGTGSANDLKHFDKKMSTKDVMISVFTSLQLQLRGKFFVKKKRRHYSSWITFITQIVTLIPEMTPGDSTSEVISLPKYVPKEERFETLRAYRRYLRKRRKIAILTAKYRRNRRMQSTSPMSHHF